VKSSRQAMRTNGAHAKKKEKCSVCKVFDEKTLDDNCPFHSSQELGSKSEQVVQA
jgi:hypothetical protein